MALKFLDKGLLDRLIVCEDDHWGAVGNPQTPIPDKPDIVTFRTFVQGASTPRSGRKSMPTTLRCCNIPAAPPDCRRAPCSAMAILTSAVSIYDVWGKAAQAKRDAVERRDLRAAAVPYYALTVILLRSLERGDLISLHQRFDVEAVMRDIEVKRATAFPACDDVDRDCQSSGSREPRSVVAGQFADRAARRCRSRSPGFSSARPT